MSCHAILQGIFPTQGSNPSFLCLLHWQVDSLPLVPPGKPAMLYTRTNIIKQLYFNKNKLKNIVLTEDFLGQGKYSVWCYNDGYMLFIILLIKPKECTIPSETESCSVVSDSLRPHGLYSLWTPGQNTGMGSPSLLQGIFPTQGSHPGFLHCRWIHQLSQKGSPRKLEWVAYPFSKGIFLTQQSNPGGLLQYRQILSQLSYQAILI